MESEYAPKCLSVSEGGFWDLTDVTLADEDIISILTDMPMGQFKAIDATWWPTLEPMQVAPPDEQILNQSKSCHLVAKFATNAGGAIWWSKFQLMQVVPSGGQNCD